MSSCFKQAAEEYGYKAENFIIYPIKVNQMRPVVEEIISHGKKFNLGLEAGSKPELHAVIAVNTDSDSLIVCNGYKAVSYTHLTLKEKFEELSAGIKASGKPAAAWFPKYTSTSLLNADNWWEALAVCEYALDTREDEKLTEGFFELIFSAFDCNVEVDLSEEEYEFWWEKVMQVCERVAVFRCV